jgi:hypothetical protein
MPQYKAFGPDAEVYGAAMLAFVKSINFTEFEAILHEHGLHEIEPERWYPQQVWLDIFSEISSQFNSSPNLVSIGMKIAETAPVPPEVQALPFEQIMLGFNEGSYLANNRGKDIGCIEASLLEAKHLLMTDKTPYPDDFVYGAYYGMAKRFLPRGTKFTVKYDERTPRREQGGSETPVHIIWE